MGITTAYTRFSRRFARHCFPLLIILLFATAAQSAPKLVTQKPPVDTSSMPDSLNRLIENIFSLIDSLEVKDSARVDIHIDTTRLVRDTIYVTTQYIEDSTLISEDLLNKLDSIAGKDILVETPATPVRDTLAAAISPKDTLRRIPPKPRPLQMCARAQAILRESKNRFTIAPSNEIPVNPIFLPIIFDGQRPDKKPGLYAQNEPHRSHHDTPYSLTRRVNNIDRDKQQAELGDYAQAVAIVAHPEKVHYTPEKMPKAIHLERMKKRREMLMVKGPSAPREFDIQGRPIKLKHWISTLYNSLQISQIYISENWYQGGTSNLNLIGSQTYSLNYKDYKDKIIFENKVQWNLNISSAPDDTLRNYSISEDLFRIDSKFGYKAFGNIYYSTSLYFKTQFFNNYKKNTDTRTASFLSPGELSYNLGMSHNYTSKNKAFTSSASVSPFSYNLKTCIDEKMDPTKYGIEEGKKILHQFGSSFDATVKWEFMRNMYISSRIYYFTSYKHVQVDFENTFNFILNRYFSTKLEFKMRYDDSAEPNERGSFLQIKEMLSFGLFFRI